MESSGRSTGDRGKCTGADQGGCAGPRDDEAERLAGTQGERSYRQTAGLCSSIIYAYGALMAGSVAVYLVDAPGQAVMAGITVTFAVLALLSWAFGVDA